MARIRNRLTQVVVLVTLATVLAPGTRAQDVAAPEAEAAGDPEARRRTIERVTGLVDRIAGEARGIDDPRMRLAVQLQAAAMLWDRNPDRAREVYVEAFESLPAAAGPGDGAPASATLREDLLAAVARRDAALAEKLAARVVTAEAAAAQDPASRAAMLANLAVEMVGSDPQRAAALARLSLEQRLTPEFGRVLVVLRGVDAPRADALYAVALEDFVHDPLPRLADARILGAYLGSYGSALLDGVAPATVRAFLETSFRMIAGTALDSPDAAAAYFFGRTLAGSFPRYLPERSAELDSRLAVLGQAIGRAAGPTGVAEAHGQSADLVHARAAEAAFLRDDEKGAHAEAAAIEDAEVRARVYGAASIRLISRRRFDEAVREIERVPSPSRRATLLVQLAHAARANGDSVYALSTLSEAVRQALREPNAPLRLQALMSISGGFATVDAIRGFEALETAVDAVNKAVLAIDPGTADAAAPRTMWLNYDATFGRLAGTDFDRALLLAGRFDTRGYRLLAELATCRGGLAAVSGDDSDGLADDDVAAGGE